MTRPVSASILLLCAAAASAAKPNFVVFYADDLGYGDLGCYGHPMSDTPNVDKLASEGMKFANMYTSSPVCSPSRAGLLTGRYQTRSGVWPGVFVQYSQYGLPSNETTFASLLKTQGYQTAMVGKWHLGVGMNWEYIPTKHGFDSWTGIPYSHDMPDPNLCFYSPEGTPGLPCFPGTNPEPMHTTTPIYDEDMKMYRLTGQDSVQIPLFNGTADSMQIMQQPANLTTLDDWYNDAAVGFVKSAAKSGKPFLLYYAFQHTHHPDYAGRMFWNTTQRGMFGDSIKALDWSLGNVLDAVKESGVEDNTLVFFSSDNGPSLVRLQRGGNAGLLRCGKGTTWEGGQRVPGIIKWPGHVAAGVLTREIASTMDLFATMLQIVGVAPPSDRVYDSVDMSSFLFSADGKAAEGAAVRDYYFYLDKNIQGPENLNAIRWREWKVHYRTTGSHCPDDYFVPTCRGNYSSGILATPLLFNLHHDDGEHVPLDITQPMYKYIVDHITQLKVEFLASPGLFGPSQIHGTDLMSQPCCHASCKQGGDPTTLPQCCRTNPY
eukprot:TRINITY_DN14561_c0_g2_i1.p1 TRINITY_DN14561_c0_g2~~TRINITY_DN14561_c0_g2_i1.p1  ORF type:complete len:546 (+),score=157.75 TRINITY_DN14561_c0_g2_i1:59-1696(+)